MVHRTRTQLAYSRGSTACLLAGLRLDDVERVQELKGVHVVDPLPHLAKLSRSLNAQFEPFTSQAQVGDLSENPEKHLGTTAVPEGVNSAPKVQQGEATEEKTSELQYPVPQTVVFNHGEGIPSNLDISLTPGTWGFGVAEKWMEHLASFESTADLWDEHLRERFLWTRSALHVHDETTASQEEGQYKQSAGERATGMRHNAFVAGHGLKRAADLWKQAVKRSSRDGACDLSRLRAALSENKRDGNEKHEEGHVRRHRESGLSQPWARRARQNSEELHDRVVLQGADSLGNTAQDNAHCLLTVLAYLATRPEVAYVDDIPPVVPLNIEAAWITQSGQENTYSIWNQGIDGRTEVIQRALPTSIRRMALFTILTYFC